MRLPGGHYQFLFRLKCSDNTKPAVVAVLEVRALRDGQEVLLASREVKATEFEGAGAWQVFTLEAEVMDGDDVRASVEFRSGVADLWCDWIKAQLVGPTPERLVELSPEFWRDRLVEPLWARRGARIGAMNLGGVGSPGRPPRLEARQAIELVSGRRGFKLRLSGDEAGLLGPDGGEFFTARLDGLKLEMGSRRLIVGPELVKVERYDSTAGAWREQLTDVLIEGWRDPEDPGKIKMYALKSYPFVEGDIADGAVSVVKLAGDVATKGDKINASTDAVFETTSTDYVEVWRVVVEDVEDVKATIDQVAAYIRVGPEGGGASPPPGGDFHEV